IENVDALQIVAAKSPRCQNGWVSAECMRDSRQRFRLFLLIVSFNRVSVGAPSATVSFLLKYYQAFPQGVQTDMGYALGLAQLGTKHPNAKPWKGEGPGVFEIVEDHVGDTYRAVYTVRFAGAVYVLHAFQKKSKTGIKTPQEDIKLIKERLKRAQQDYESRGEP